MLRRQAWTLIGSREARKFAYKLKFEAFKILSTALPTTFMIEEYILNAHNSVYTPRGLPPCREEVCVF
jgi:hypothetical protein